MINKFKVIISLIILLSMMLILFRSSNESYQQQSLIPLLNRMLANEPLKNILSHIQFTYAGRNIAIDEIGYSSFIEFFIRKAAHFFTYFIMGCCSFALIKQFVSQPVYRILLAWFIPIAYAILDEIHQSFTPGRTPLWQDVALDSVGAITGIMIYYYFRKNKL